jgi:hypothetical protein
MTTRFWYGQMITYRQCWNDSEEIFFILANHRHLLRLTILSKPTIQSHWISPNLPFCQNFPGPDLQLCYFFSCSLCSDFCLWVVTFRVNFNEEDKKSLQNTSIRPSLKAILVRTISAFCYVCLWSADWLIDWLIGCLFDWLTVCSSSSPLNFGCNSCRS